MLFTDIQRTFAEQHSELMFLNPFLWRQVWDRFLELGKVELACGQEAAARMQIRVPLFPDVEPFYRRVEMLAEQARADLLNGTSADQSEQKLYEELVFSVLLWRHRSRFADAVRGGHDVQPLKEFFQTFSKDHAWFLNKDLGRGVVVEEPAQLFALFFQIVRAFRAILDSVHGNSKPIRQLRASIWCSIFTVDFRMYKQVLFDRMHDINTLICGPTGTGKELVASAIGVSRFVAYDAKQNKFVERFDGAFHPVNLSALPRELIESELFGHSAGAFTGAAQERVGWFEVCKASDSVFLDEIGELEESLQVKLLRVLQTRQFNRVGETSLRHFQGKVIAATNRDLPQEIHAGRFRDDLYYRLCADIVRTPSLREQLDDCPDDLGYFVKRIAERVLGNRADKDRVDGLSQRVIQWLLNSKHLGSSYSWPGNFRELEQCVRNVLVQGEYHPASIRRSQVVAKSEFSAPVATDPPQMNRTEEMLNLIRDRRLSYDELLEFYCSYIFAKSGNMAEVARQLKKHRRTVQSRINESIVEQFRES